MPKARYNLDLHLMPFRSMPTDHGLPTNMTDDWITHVSNRMPDIDRRISSTALRNALIESNYGDMAKGFGFGCDYKKYKNTWSSWLDANVAKKYQNSRCASDDLVRTYRVDEMPSLIDMASFILGKRAEFVESNWHKNIIANSGHQQWPASYFVASIARLPSVFVQRHFNNQPCTPLK